MTISIITVQHAPNYGAMLQCYALYRYLKGRGYDTKVIDLLRPVHKGYISTPGYEALRPHRSSTKHKIKMAVLKRVHRLTSIAKGSWNRDKKIQKIADEITTKIYEFDSNVSFTDRYESIAQLIDNTPKSDVYMVGSDQLWNPTQNYPLQPFFLTFVKGGKKVSYGTSIGITELTSNEKRLFAHWLSDFDAISVRENSAKTILKSLLPDKEIEVVCDPTLLIAKDQWQQIATMPGIDEKYLFLFLLYDNKGLLDFARAEAKRRGLKLVILTCVPPNIRRIANRRLDNIIVANVNQWLGYIAKSEMVLTDSFHGTVFSLIFHKEFYVHIPRYNNRGSRIHDLLKPLGLSNRILSETLTSSQVIDEPPINFKKVEDMLDKQRQKSISFLDKALY